MLKYEIQKKILLKMMKIP